MNISPLPTTRSWIRLLRTSVAFSVLLLLSACPALSGERQTVASETPHAAVPSAPPTAAAETTETEATRPDWTSNVQAWSSAATAALTLVIVWVYWGQLKAMKAALAETKKASDAALASANAAHASIVMTHRPKIIVRNLVSPEASKLFAAGPPSANDFANVVYANLADVTELTGTFQIINKGSSPVARVRLINATMFIGPVLPAINPCTGHNVVANMEAIPSGHQAQDIPLIPKTVNASQMLQIRQGQTFIFAIGKVLYEDELGGVRRTGFTRRFDMHTGRFTPVQGEPDYEYVD